MRPGIKRKAVAAALAVFAAAAFFGVRYFLDACYYPPVLMYHNIERVDGGSLYVLPVQFGEQMKFLREHKYNVVPLSRLGEMIRNKEKIPRNTVVITIDDGNKNNYIEAFPYLKEYNIPATIFVISDFIGTGGYLIAKDMKEMASAGIEFGSHTKTHRNMKDASREVMAMEIGKSKKDIEAASGRPVTVFCYPFGESPSFGREVLKGAGIDAACVNMPRDDSITLDAYRIKRIKVSTTRANLAVFRAKVSGYYTWLKVHRWNREK